ncbi:hypothetical protein KC19_5G161600 [Ceratodon purpureus]|uniref:Uncharacterized protein n=1 Tax=Ceratodon purpureus TaxID=3225 RepID=A0A8T0I3B3_CERPU|nr:hypothetical protein KC19_5G161600 [Ceratodon purpureus]
MSGVIIIAGRLQHERSSHYRSKRQEVGVPTIAANAKDVRSSLLSRREIGFNLGLLSSLAGISLPEVFKSMVTKAAATTTLKLGSRCPPLLCYG